MTALEYSSHWFRRIPNDLLEWGDFFLAIKAEIQEVIASGHLGHGSVYLSESRGTDFERHKDEAEVFELTFTFSDGATLVYWANEFIGADKFTINHDLSWAYDPDDMGTIGELPLEFSSWLDVEESVAGKVAVLAVAIARAWLRNPPNQRSGMAFEVRGPWADC